MVEAESQNLIRAFSSLDCRHLVNYPHSVPDLRNEGGEEERRGKKRAGEEAGEVTSLSKEGALGGILTYSLTLHLLYRHEN